MMKYRLENLIDPRSHKPNSPAIIKKDLVYTYHELDNLSSSFSRSDATVIRQNEYVGIYLDNSPAFIISVLALWKLGAVPVPINLLATNDELINLINIAGISAIITEELYSQRFQTVIMLSNRKIKTIIYRTDHEKGEAGETRLQVKKQTTKKEAVVIFTSGASGEPKGVVHTFNSLLSSIINGNEIFHHNIGDRWLGGLPFYHIGGFQIICRAIYYGAAIIIPQSLQTDHISEAIKEYKPTHTSFVSTQLKRLLENNVKPNDELRCSLIGGGFIDKKLLLDAKVSGWHPVKVYGSSETASFICVLKENDVEDNGDSTGKPIGNNRINIVDENGEEFSIQTEGEIVIKSESLFKNYLNNKSETENKLKQASYFTGDLGYIDDFGFLFVTGRKNEMIVTGGKNVNPIEVESVILKYPGIVETAVFPIDDVEWGEIICAAIVTSIKIDTRDLRTFLKKELSSYKVPKKIFVENILPRTSLGKIERSKLKKKYSGN
jgi:o-succinylbenzoate---CoA ligase